MGRHENSPGKQGIIGSTLSSQTRFLSLAILRASNLIAFVCCLIPSARSLAAANPSTVSWTTPCDVVWNSPSEDASGSMPLGNGEVGINLWVEKNGDLLFYISRSDSLSEISRLLKIGRIRISLSPNPFVDGATFRQQLHLADGRCEISATNGAQRVDLTVFVDAQHPVVHCFGKSTTPVTVRASVESWRTTPHLLAAGEEQQSAWTLHDAPFELMESADVFAPAPSDAVVWYHRNENSLAFVSTMKVQSLETVADRVDDPLLHRTFGGWLTGAGFKAVAGHALTTVKPITSFSLRVAAPCRQTDTSNIWLNDAQAMTTASSNDVEALTQTADWWHLFWDRSSVIVGNPNDAQSPSSEAALVTRSYTLQRYVQACGGRGRFPIKFNGGIFTVEPRAMGKPFDPDWRAWGDCHWWQNVRHMYHPMLASGDFEMMDPLFDMYEAARPLCEARARLYHGVDGCYFPETMTVWGAYSNGDYGWDRTGHKPSEVLCPWWANAWNQGPELVALMLDRWDYTDERAFLKKQVLPMAESVLKYFDQRFKRDADGKLIISPTQSIETYWTGVTNDLPCVAGLTDITRRLCDLPDDLTTPAQRKLFQRMKTSCPSMPTQQVEENGREVTELAPAQNYDPKRTNVENPELYAVWPFRLFGIGKRDIDLAVTAYRHRQSHLDVGWGYDGNCAALLGLTDEAKRILLKKCHNSNPAYRWPATWGPNYDWLPDQNHGGNLLETTELMLLQSDGDTIRLLPAWPKDWDVRFKLHAAHNTIVECTFRNGKIENLEVTPTSRRKDVLLPE